MCLWSHDLKIGSMSSSVLPHANLHHDIQMMKACSGKDQNNHSRPKSCTVMGFLKSWVIFSTVNSGSNTRSYRLFLEVTNTPRICFILMMNRSGDMHGWFSDISGNCMGVEQLQICQQKIYRLKCAICLQYWR